MKLHSTICSAHKIKNTLDDNFYEFFYFFNTSMHQYFDFVVRISVVGILLHCMERKKGGSDDVKVAK